jgi:hypothetical protein
MGSTLDLGRRIELISMDPHYSNITIGLYEQMSGSAAEYVVHSYSGLAGVTARLQIVMRAMQVLGGLQMCEGRLRFVCSGRHQAAMRRTFLEACKLAEVPADPRPLQVLDKKVDRTFTARSLGGGIYEVAAEGPREGWAARAESIAGGLRKLASLDAVSGEPDRIHFACAQPHDAVVGLLLPRALNVRAALREQEMAAARGTLAAPSAQK